MHEGLYQGYEYVPDNLPENLTRHELLCEVNDALGGPAQGLHILPLVLVTGHESIYNGQYAAKDRVNQRNATLYHWKRLPEHVQDTAAGPGAEEPTQQVSDTVPTEVLLLSAGPASAQVEADAVEEEMPAAPAAVAEQAINTEHTQHDRDSEQVYKSGKDESAAEEDEPAKKRMRTEGNAKLEMQVRSPLDMDEDTSTARIG